MAITTHPDPPAAVAESRLARWLDRYGAAWEARDGEAAAELFTAGAVYHWGPFDVLHGVAAVTRRWAAATADQRDISFEHAPLGLAGGLAYAHWRCRFRRRSTGLRCELDGVFVLRFDEDGRCSELREWWLQREVGKAQDAGSPAGRRNG